MRWTDAGDLDISIVVPAMDEAENLRPLVERIDRALAEQKYEILIVDDGSQDRTPEVCDELGRQYPIHLYVRTNPTGGLSGAVLHGLARARGQWLVVMDADLQHPPEQVPDLLGPLQSNDAEFVIGSRYVRGASTDGRWGFLRRANSWCATLLAKPFAGDTRDPMSGFFALRRETYLQARDLNPIGYKIALELMCKCQVRQVREVPIRFGLRLAGESKLNLQQQVRYLDHLSGLYDFSFPRAATWGKFILAIACAWLAAFGLFARLVERDVSPVLAPALAFAAAAIATATFHLRSLRRNGRPINSLRDWLDFSLVLLGEWSVCTLASRWLGTHIEHLSVTQFFLVTFGATAIARYALRTSLCHNLQGIRRLPTPQQPKRIEPEPMRHAA
jgi:dolichol-phosphate mannosyltransferase